MVCSSTSCSRIAGTLGRTSFSRESTDSHASLATSIHTTDKLRSYPEAIERLKRHGQLPRDTRHRTSKYLNNIIEADHGALKQVIKPTRGFQTIKTATATIKGFEIMRMIRRGHCLACKPGVRNEIRFVNQLLQVAANPQAPKAGKLRLRWLMQQSLTGEDSPMSHLLLSVMGAFAQSERDLIRERQREGIALAKAARRSVRRAKASSNTRASKGTASPRGFR